MASLIVGTILMAFAIALATSQDVWPDAPGPVQSQPSDPENLSTRECCTPRQWYGREVNKFSGVSGEFWYDDRLKLALFVWSDGSWELFDQQVSKNYTMLADGFCYAPPLQSYYRTSECIPPDATYVGQYVDADGGTAEQWEFTYANGQRGTIAYDSRCMIAMQALYAPDGVTQVMNYTYSHRMARFFDPTVFDQVDTSTCIDMMDFEYNVNLTEFRNEYVYYY